MGSQYVVSITYIKSCVIHYYGEENVSNNKYLSQVEHRGMKLKYVTIVTHSLFITIEL